MTASRLFTSSFCKTTKMQIVKLVGRLKRYKDQWLYQLNLPVDVENTGRANGNEMLHHEMRQTVARKGRQTKKYIVRKTICPEQTVYEEKGSAV